MPAIRVTRWPGDRPPDEAAIRACFAAEGLAPYAWANSPRVSYAPHRHSYHKVLYVVRGSIRFELPERGEILDLDPGDRLDLPANVVHSALVGPQGVSCLEAAR